MSKFDTSVNDETNDRNSKDERTVPRYRFSLQRLVFWFVGTKVLNVMGTLSPLIVIVGAILYGYVLLYQFAAVLP